MKIKISMREIHDYYGENICYEFKMNCFSLAEAEEEWTKNILNYHTKKGNYQVCSCKIYDDNDILLGKSDGWQILFEYKEYEFVAKKNFPDFTDCQIRRFVYNVQHWLVYKDNNKTTVAGFFTGTEHDVWGYCNLNGGTYEPLSYIENEKHYGKE